MLSLKYVDLLNCSELIQNLKVFTKGISQNADSTQAYLSKHTEILDKCRRTKKVIGSALQPPVRTHGGLSANDEHLFYVAGQKLILSHCQDLNPLETLFIITTFLNVYRAYEVEYSVKRTSNTLKPQLQFANLLLLHRKDGRAVEFTRGRLVR